MKKAVIIVFLACACCFAANAQVVGASGGRRGAGSGESVYFGISNVASAGFRKFFNEWDEGYYFSDGVYGDLG